MLHALLLTVALANPALAQTKITPDKNSYTPAQDVKLGREAAAEARKQLPMLNDRRVDDYVETVGGRLVEAIPAEFRHPGVPLHLRRRQPEGDQRLRAAGRTDVPQPRHDRGLENRGRGGRRHGARDLARRASPRHGAGDQGTEVPDLARSPARFGGAIVGGAAGSVIAQGSQFGLGAYFMKYGREYERQADLLGAQIMARAGYDPREMANMFRTIEERRRRQRTASG